MTAEAIYRKAFAAYVAKLQAWAAKQPAKRLLEPWPRDVTQGALDEFVRVAGPGMTQAMFDGVEQGVKVPHFPTENREGAIKLANPHAEAFAQEYLPNLIVEIDDATMAGVQAIIRRGFTEELSVDAIARRIRGYQPRGGGPYVEGVVGLHDAWADAVDNYRTQLAAQGYPPDKIAEHAATYAKRLKARRGENIARTEVRRAQEAGTQVAWSSAERAGLTTKGTVRRWIVAWDDRTCPICAPLANQIAPINGTFPGGYDRPPAHPGCRCTVALITPTSTRQLPTPKTQEQLDAQAERNAEHNAKRRSLKPTER